MTDSCDVLVVGAGLAGLQCARELQEAGREVQVWEAADDVGGRIRTEQVDGFLVDRGFQVLNPAYSAVRRWVDVDALQLGSFTAGIGVRRDDRLAVLAHPLKEPRLLPGTLRSGLLQPRELLALVRWTAPAFVPAAPRRGGSRDDVPLRQSLDDAGLSGELRRVLQRFLAGVLLEDDGSTSTAFARQLIRTFALGVPGLPRHGMQALPRQLADALATPVLTGTRVDSLAHAADGVLAQAAGRSIRARHVVAATDPVTAGRLTADGGPAGGGTPAGTPAMKGVLTHWFSVGEPPPLDLPLLCVDGRTPPGGPVVNAAVVSKAAPGYAPPGRHLVQASSLHGSGRPVPGDDEVARHAAEILGADAGGWELVARHDVRSALPVQPPPWIQTPPSDDGPVRSPSGILVCGDHREAASIQGALESGHRAARALLR